MGPKQDFTCHDPQTGGGQVLFVLKGELLHEGTSIAPRGAVAATRGESAICFTSGAHGVQALLMQYPQWML